MNDTESQQREEPPQQRRAPLFFSPLTTAATLQRALYIYLKSGTVRMFVQLALLVVIPTTAIMMTIVYLMMDQHSGNESWQKLYERYYVVVTTGSFLQKTLGTISDGAIAVAVADLYLQRSPDWMICLRKAISKAKILVLAGVVSWIATQVGFVFGFVPGVFLRIQFVSLIPLIVLDDSDCRSGSHTPLSALGRSWKLSTGRRWYVLWCLVSLNSLFLLTDWLLRCLLKENSNQPFLNLSFHLLKTIPSTMITPLRGILKTVMYINLLVLQDDMIEEGFAQQIERGRLEATTEETSTGVSREPLLSAYENDDDDNEAGPFSSDPPTPVVSPDETPREKEPDTTDVTETKTETTALLAPKAEDSLLSPR